jgi:enoyl-[acyl-carrier-protein] reductase (NADH)
MSDYASGVTGEITFVDGGFNVIIPAKGEAT